MDGDDVEFCAKVLKKRRPRVSALSILLSRIEAQIVHVVEGVLVSDYGAVRECMANMHDGRISVLTDGQAMP